jgi:hypothetical protein
MEDTDPGPISILVVALNGHVGLGHVSTAELVEFFEAAMAGSPHDPDFREIVFDRSEREPWTNNRPLLSRFINIIKIY